MRLEAGVSPTRKIFQYTIWEPDPHQKKQRPCLRKVHKKTFKGVCSERLDETFSSDSNQSHIMVLW